MTRPLELGLSITPLAERPAAHVELARAADQGGLDLIGVQDHPYQPRFLDTWTLLSVLAAHTERVRLFPNVANLPLRPPAVLAKAAASLDVLSGGRVELGLGGGGFLEPVEAMGGPHRTPGESVDAVAEAIEVIRLAWSDERSVSFEGRHYRLHGYHPGPAPAHPIEVWLGAVRPRMLALTGRASDGWVAPLLTYLPAEAVPAAQDAIDEAARAAGRDPSAVRRLMNAPGTITDGARGAGPLDGPVEHWVETLASFARDLRFDTFIFWPGEEGVEQVERFAGEVAPALRAELAS
jgi:alkanesulfonate monooxygenase SsuD/methylene tetrahydromethanopterin reductase-like flavin-dependent oxidoreductase (luciferase family)